MNNLKELNIRNCKKLKELPKEIGKLTNLEELEIDCKNLEELPKKFLI